MKSDLPAVIALALLPALGNMGGGLLAEWLRPSKTLLNLALHAAAGIILAVVAVEVMPRALGASPAAALALVFVAGGVAYVILETAIERWQNRAGAGAGQGAWMVYVAVATDLVGDGLLIGAGSAVSTELGLVLAVGQVLADVPEGFAVIANFRAKGVSRGRRMLISASFALPVILSALFAYFVLRTQGEPVKMLALVFVAGLYVLAAVEDMLGEAHERSRDTRGSALSLVTGFALFVLVSDGIG